MLADHTSQKHLFIETYGCQMNIADSELIAAILGTVGYELTDDLAAADAVVVNTCSIRDNAEQRVKGRLSELCGIRKHRKIIIGIMGCMAQRLGDELLSMGADIVAGPDSYRDLPHLFAEAELGHKSISAALSTTETYSDLRPVRLPSSAFTAFVSIMRGCNNFCSYCIVPYTRGRERSRSVQSILEEIATYQMNGRHEITLIGQNVNSYNYKDEQGNTTSFATLLSEVATQFPDLRIRFTTSHPKDMTDDILETIAKYPNVCNHIHLPLQSGSSRILKLMNRHYNIDDYMARIESIRRIIPDCGITTDVFCGFSSETEEDHKETLRIMEEVGYDSAFMFQYSERPGTYAAKHLPDNVPADVKNRRLQEIIALQNRLSLESNNRDVNKVFDVMIEGRARRSAEQVIGRTQQNKAVVLAAAPDLKVGSIVKVKITSASQATLFGERV
ncbi:MAG: tRNA (N6-isopentenyl adenosine(37)-C2)-methylthiotransferase MiaB [Bacteroidales bacterium]|nr:tRNA (N6-isopentenyl adenosine(37)-C2)-methylthiotransferase MiaB [Bacteroidales bacterium]